MVESNTTKYVLFDLINSIVQGEDWRGERRADANACRRWTEGGGEHLNSPPLVTIFIVTIRFCWSSPTSRICRMQWTPQRSRTSWAFTAWETETGTFRWDSVSSKTEVVTLSHSGNLCDLWRRPLRRSWLAEQPAQERRSLNSSPRPSLDIDRIYTFKGLLLYLGI